VFAKEITVGPQQEYIHAALALVLGPETDYQLRQRAAQRLARSRGPILSLLLTTLTNYPEITSPEWPWYPPQYEHTAHLLLTLCQREHLQLEDLLHHPALQQQPAGPVLWISLLEAAGMHTKKAHEQLLRDGLNTDWMMTRYAAAMALSQKACYFQLQPETLQMLHCHQGAGEAYPVRLTASYALLHAHDQAGLEGLLDLLNPYIPIEVRKAAIFTLATEPALRLPITQRKKLVDLLFSLLNDADQEVVQQAAHALSKLMFPSHLPRLFTLLLHGDMEQKIVLLTTLEEIAPRPRIRTRLRQQALPTHLLPFLQHEHPELRRQACYTLAACGGEYAAAVFGTIVGNPAHPGHCEALESIRHLNGALHAPLRGNITRWLVQALETKRTEVQATALDSLIYLIWQASTFGPQKAWREMSRYVSLHAPLLSLLQTQHVRIRQRTIELLSALGYQLTISSVLEEQLLQSLLIDKDSKVRAAIAQFCGQISAYQAVPALLQALLDSNKQVAITALLALEQMMLTMKDHSIILYVMQELVCIHKTRNETLHELSQQAQRILDNWQQQL
jgi:HEAT repeat protein